MTVSIFLNLLIPKNNPDFFENNQATACTEYLANTPPMCEVGEVHPVHPGLTGFGPGKPGNPKTVFLERA